MTTVTKNQALFFVSITVPTVAYNFLNGMLYNNKQQQKFVCNGTQIRQGRTTVFLVSDIAVFVLKRDVKLQLTN